MNELLKVEVNENGEPTISGRMLYDFLEVKENIPNGLIAKVRDLLKMLILYHIPKKRKVVELVELR